MNPAYLLSDEHREIREAIRSISKKEIAPHASAVDAEARYPQEAHDALRAAGFHAVHVPEEYGGAGADALATCLVIEEIARSCMSSSLIPIANLLGSLPVQIAGSEDLKATYLNRLAAGNGNFSSAIAEAAAGSDVAGMGTRAIRHADHWVLDGVKGWVTGAGVADFYTVFAVTDAEAEPEAETGRISAFVVESDDPGVSFGPPMKKLGVRGSPTRELNLDEVVLPIDRIIGEPGSGMETMAKSQGLVGATIAAQAVGVAQGALDHALTYVTEREQFGKPVAEFQGMQFMLADMGMRVEAARQLTYAAAARCHVGSTDQRLLAASAKCFASDVAMQVTTDAVQALGGYGYTRDYPVERMMRDAKVTQVYAGTNQMQRIEVARQLLAGIRVAG